MTPIVVTIVFLQRLLRTGLGFENTLPIFRGLLTETYENPFAQTPIQTL